MRVVEVIVELKANAENRVGYLFLSLSYFEQSLAELTTKVENWAAVIVGFFVQGVELDAELPAAFPRLFVRGTAARYAVNAFAVGRAETGECVTQSPALMQCCL